MHKQAGKLVLWSGVLVACLVLATPAAQAVQLSQLDPAVQAAALNGANRVALAVEPGLTMATGAEVAPDVVAETEELLPTPTPAAEDVAEPTPTPEAEVEEPTPVAAEEAEPTPTPAGEEAPPTVDFATVEKTQYDNEGVSFQAPVDWEVTVGDFGTLFNIAIPNQNFMGMVQSLEAEDFPGILAVVLFRSLAEGFVQAFDETAQLVAVEDLGTGQQLPILKIVFDAEFDGEPGRGAVYVVSPGSDAYMLVAYSDPEAWAALEPGVDLVAESIFFDPELITLTTAEAGPLVYSDAGETLEIEVPEGWQVADTPDDQFPLVVVDPDFRLAGALGAMAGSPEDEGIDLQALLDAEDGEADPAVVDALVQTIISGMDMTSDEFVIDETLTEVFTGEDAVTIRLVGDAQLDETMSAPIILYMDIRTGGVVAEIIFGDAALALEQEDALLGMVQTAQVLQ